MTPCYTVSPVPRPHGPAGDEIFRRVSVMSPGELAALAAHLQQVERAAIIELRAPVTLAPDSAYHTHTSETVSITDSVSVTVTPGDVRSGSGAGHWGPTGSAVGTSPPAVTSLWDDIKPKSPQDALAVSAELRRWVIVFMLILGSAAVTPGLRAALQDAFVSSINALQEDLTSGSDVAKE